MPHATSLPPGVIETDVNYYLEPPNGEAYPIYTTNTAAAKRQKWNAQKVQVTDLRGHEDEFDVDTHGFQVVPFPTKETTFDDDDSIKREVYPGAIELIKKTTGATYVHIMNHIVRNKPHQAVLDLPKDLPDDAEVNLQTPGMLAHVDQSYDGAWAVIGDIKEAEMLKPKTKTRWGIINVWHPIKTVQREPLAVCDARSVAEEDLRPVKLRVKRPRDGVMGEFDVELWYVAHNPAHKWYWPKNLTPDEALLIKCFDSKKDGRARRAPHSAIRSPEDDGPPRESIEIRCAVFWEDEDLE